MNSPSVVIIGAGFGGINVVKKLAEYDVNITLIDKNNFHTFYPLLYQVGAAELTSEQIAFPIRKLLQKYDNTEFIMDEVINIDRDNQLVVLEDGVIVEFDFLVVATGSEPFFFGVEGAEKYCHTIDSLQSGEGLRNQILSCFEEASITEDKTQRKELLRFVIVGAGPTGVEFASALSELINGPLQKDFPNLEIDEVEVILLEALDKVLPMLDGNRIHSIAYNQLQKRNVSIHLNTEVTKVSSSAIHTAEGQEFKTKTKIWSAGVCSPPILEEWGLPVNERGDVIVRDTLHIEDSSRIFAIGDITHLEDDKGDPLPNLAPVAIQQGKHVAQNIGRQVTGKLPTKFRYLDKGDLVVLGRYDAVARIWGREFGGLFAWFIWGIVHIFYLIGFRNRLFVLINWFWDLFRMEKVERLIIPPQKEKTSHEIVHNIPEQ